MPIGITVNSLSIFFGGLIGAILGNKLPKKLQEMLIPIFGLASMGMGVNSLIKMKTLPAVILALIIGSAIGILLDLETQIESLVKRVQRPLNKVLRTNTSANDDDQVIFMQELVTIIVLFCASGSGIYGSLVEGMTGDSSILLTKSFLDLFTAAIFGASMGYIILAIAIPQFIVFVTLFISARFIMPLATPEMISDFSACGGLLLLATGFRISGLKNFPTAAMLPALILVMPVSYLWTIFMI